jgi:hypothetical protein
MSKGPRYKILRTYYRRDLDSEVIEQGLTLEEAQEHCNDPETSSRTATSEEAQERTRTMGPWFDCYMEEPA